MLRASLKIVGACSLLLVGLVGWLAYCAHDARTRVHTFCAGVSVGQASDGLAQRARAQGLEVVELSAPEGAEPAEATVLCIKGVMLARHICEIRHRAGRVTRASTGFVD